MGKTPIRENRSMRRTNPSARRLVQAIGRLGLNFTEAIGKAIAFVNVINDPPKWQAHEIRFADPTLLHCESSTIQIETKSKYMEVRRDDLELIRNFNTLLTERDKRVRQQQPVAAERGIRWIAMHCAI
jgi:hypothetical protein